jgi:hypothetical protein
MVVLFKLLGGISKMKIAIPEGLCVRDGAIGELLGSGNSWTLQKSSRQVSFEADGVTIHLRWFLSRL